jgi:hypothetical protein
MTNGHDKAPKEQPAITIKKIEQNTNHVVKPAQSTVPTEDLEQFSLAIKPLVVPDEATEQIFVTNAENQLNGKLEQTASDVKKSQESVVVNEECKQFTNGYQKLEHSTVVQEDIEQPVGNKNYTPTNDKLEQSATAT